MAYDKTGHVVVSNGGAVGTGEGSLKKIHHYATNDADTVVEADGYFDGAAEMFTPGKGDLILASLDCDGTAEAKMYIVNRTGDDIALTAMLIA